MIDSETVNCANLPKNFYGNVTEKLCKTISKLEKGCYNVVCVKKSVVAHIFCRNRENVFGTKKGLEA